MDCTTIGDGDLYGKGVRIGLYLQWASGFILRNLGSWDRVSAVRTTSNIICASLALTTAINCVKGNALSFDYLIVYYLTVVLFYAESYNLIAKETPVASSGGESDSSRRMLEHRWKGMRLYPDIPLVFQNALFACQSLFGAWFWIDGIEKQHTSKCPEIASLLGLFELRNRAWRHFATAMAIITGIIFAVFFVLHLSRLRKGVQWKPVLVVSYYLLPVSGAPRGMQSTNSKENMFLELSGLLRPEFPAIRPRSINPVYVIFQIVHYACIYIMGPLLSIVSVERMLFVNNITTSGIYNSSGQVIALLSGVIAAAIAIWELLSSQPVIAIFESVTMYKIKPAPDQDLNIESSLEQGSTTTQNQTPSHAGIPKSTQTNLSYSQSPPELWSRRFSV
ncbi:hypothetical protein MMC06_003434 [Schaereria dolodes]|nr:hypothetical protein [Schaereria dolodes]